MSFFLLIFVLYQRVTNSLVGLYGLARNTSGTGLGYTFSFTSLYVFLRFRCFISNKVMYNATAIKHPTPIIKTVPSIDFYNPITNLNNNNYRNIFIAIYMQRPPLLRIQLCQ